MPEPRVARWTASVSCMKKCYLEQADRFPIGGVGRVALIWSYAKKRMTPTHPHQRDEVVAGKVTDRCILLDVEHWSATFCCFMLHCQ